MEKKSISESNFVKIENEIMSLPIDFGISIGLPKKIYLRISKKKEIFVYSSLTNNIYSAFKFKIFVFLFGLKSGIFLFDPEGNENYVQFKFKKSLEFMNGHFGIANYNPMYFLSPIQNIASSRIELVNNETWQNIEDYHEHLEISLQSSESHKVTDLLINTIYNFHEDPKRILELGCGSGRNLKKLALAFPNSEVIGVDINNAAKSTLFPGNVRFINCNVLEFDFSQFEKFDLILTSGFLMHINHLLLPNLMTKIMQNSKRQIFWELHGNSNSWDFHRYPRNYAEFLINNGYSFDRYTVYCQHPIFSKGLTSNFAHSLLVRAE